MCSSHNKVDKTICEFGFVLIIIRHSDSVLSTQILHRTTKNLMDDSLVPCPCTQMSLIPLHPDSLSAHLSSRRSSTSRFIHSPPVIEPESPTPNVRKRRATSSSERVFTRRSEVQPFGATGKECPETDYFEEEIHEMFKVYQAKSEQSFSLFKDELIQLFKTVKLKSGNSSSLFKDIIGRCMLPFSKFC